MNVFIHYFIYIIFPLLICGCLLLIAVIIIQKYRYGLLQSKFEAVKNEIENFMTNMIFPLFDAKLLQKEILKFKKTISFFLSSYKCIDFIKGHYHFVRQKSKLENMEQQNFKSLTNSTE